MILRLPCSSIHTIQNIVCLYIADIEELLGKPVQTELSTETELDIAIDMLTDLINGKIIIFRLFTIYVFEALIAKSIFLL